MSSSEELPKFVSDRLKGMRSANNPNGLFTSDLSVNEYLLVKEAGFEPLGLVMGSSIYHVGLQLARLTKSCELEVLTQALYEARELAMSRMEAEAQALGADGVVGVNLTVNNVAWGENLAEFQAIGTAVISKDTSKNFKTDDGKPFTSDLSGQDFWTLLKAGYRPLSLVMGTCVYHIAFQGFMASISNIGKNIEMPNFTQGLYDARELAMERMQQDTKKYKAEGIVGVRLAEGNYKWSSHIIEFFCVGTAVKPMSENHVIETPTMVMLLNDK
jgi:uncharacterized protein YbjQ (UPF0145 family)